MPRVSKELARNDKKEGVFVQNVVIPSFFLMCPTVALLTQFPFRFSNLDSIIHPTQGVSKEIKSNEGFDPALMLSEILKS